MNEPATTTDNLMPERYYHGTRADLKPGDLIVPGYNSNYGSGQSASFVYFAATLDAATWGAELAVGEGPGRSMWWNRPVQSQMIST